MLDNKFIPKMIYYEKEKIYVFILDFNLETKKISYKIGENKIEKRDFEIETDESLSQLIVCKNDEKVVFALPLQMLLESPFTISKQELTIDIISILQPLINLVNDKKVKEEVLNEVFNSIKNIDDKYDLQILKN